MKVLQINSFFTVGGPPRIMNGIYDTLKENGFECKIAAAREKMYVPEDSIQIGTDTSIKLNAITTRFLDNEGFTARWDTKKLIQQIEKYDPDLILLQNLHGYYINIELLFDYLKGKGCPVAWTLHDCWPMTGHCAYFDYAKCDKWKTGCFDCKCKGNYPKSVFMERSEKNYKKKKRIFTGVKNMTIVTPSQWLADIVKQSFLNCYPVEVINNGINTAVFKPTESDVRKRYGLKDEFVVLGVAQVWDHRKGLNFFVELNSIMPSHYKIILVGLNDNQIKALPKEIIGLKKTNSVQELVELYSAADVFVNPTLEDNYPTTNIEAIACGTPVVTFRTGGSPETIVNNMGMVAEEKNTESLLKTIQEIELKKFECDFNRESVNSRFCYQAYISLFRKILR